jgi:hypothetical protein
MVTSKVVRRAVGAGVLVVAVGLLGDPVAADPAPGFYGGAGSDSARGDGAQAPVTGVNDSEDVIQDNDTDVDQDNSDGADDDGFVGGGFGGL